MKTLLNCVLLLLASTLMAVAEADVLDELAPIQQRWAEIQYQFPARQKAAAFEALATEAAALKERHPHRAEPLVWEGIVLSTWAGAKGGLGALSLAKRAKADLEAAIAIDGESLQGSAYTSLGSLYYQVPGWPIGFGDDAKAEQYLRQGLRIAPDGIDANFFYGDYLYRQGRYGEAVGALEKALQAPPRPGRESADAGRKGEIQERLTQARARHRG